MANNKQRPPGTQLLIDESYVEGLEEDIQEKDRNVQVWKACIEHTTDFLEILREHFDKFDQVLKQVNEASDRIEFIIDADENIKYRVDES